MYHGEKLSKLYYYCHFRQPDGGKGSVTWKQFDLTERSYLDIDISDTQRNNWKSDMNDFWSTQVPPIKLYSSDVKDHDEL